MRIDVIQVKDKFVVRIRKTIFGYGIPSTTQFVAKDLDTWSLLSAVLKYCLFDTYEEAKQIEDLFNAVKGVSR